jgi:hypothetical protein
VRYYFFDLTRRVFLIVVNRLGVAADSVSKPELTGFVLLLRTCRVSPDMAMVAHPMRKPRSRITNQALLIDLVERSALIEAHLSTLFMMQCELFAYLNKSKGPSFVEEWSDARFAFLKENLADMSERLRELAKGKPSN